MRQASARDKWKELETWDPKTLLLHAEHDEMMKKEKKIIEIENEREFQEENCFFLLQRVVEKFGTVWECFQWNSIMIFLQTLVVVTNSNSSSILIFHASPSYARYERKSN